VARNVAKTASRAGSMAMVVVRVQESVHSGRIATRFVVSTVGRVTHHDGGSERGKKAGRKRSGK